MKYLKQGTESTCRWCGEEIIFTSFGYSDVWVRAKDLDRREGERENDYQGRIGECEDGSGRHYPKDYCWSEISTGRCLTRPRPNEPVVACGRHMKDAIHIAERRAERAEAKTMRSYKDLLTSEKAALLREYGLRGFNFTGWEGSTVSVHYDDLIELLEQMKMDILRARGEINDDHPFGNSGQEDPGNISVH